MHGNTYTLSSGYKTRDFNKIVSETKLFFTICHQNKIKPGGVHLEMSGNDDTSECINGLVKNSDININNDCYKSKCDPRLNLSQCIEYAFKLYKYI